MLAKANCSVCICDQKNNKNWWFLSREKMIARQQERKSRVRKSCAHRRFLRPQIKPQKKRERERRRERERKRKREHVISIILQVIYLYSHFLENDNKTPQRRFVYLR